MLRYLELAKMSEAAYELSNSPSNNPLENNGWSRFLNSQDNNSGFHACAFVSKDSSDVVVSIRGTDCSRNLLDDACIKAGFSPTTLKLVDQFIDDVKSKVAKEYPGATIIYTGHSLGADYAAYISVKYNGKAALFDPWAPSKVPDIIANELKCSVDQVREYLKNNTRTILGPDNLCNEQGKRFSEGFNLPYPADYKSLFHPDTNYSTFAKYQSVNISIMGCENGGFADLHPLIQNEKNAHAMTNLVKSMAESSYAEKEFELHANTPMTPDKNPVVIKKTNIESEEIKKSRENIANGKQEIKNSELDFKYIKPSQNISEDQNQLTQEIENLEKATSIAQATLNEMKQISCDSPGLESNQDEKERSVNLPLVFMQLSNVLADGLFQLQQTHYAQDRFQQNKKNFVSQVQDWETRFKMRLDFSEMMSNIENNKQTFNFNQMRHNVIQTCSSSYYDMCVNRQKEFDQVSHRLAQLKLELNLNKETKTSLDGGVNETMAHLDKLRRKVEKIKQETFFGPASAVIGTLGGIASIIPNPGSMVVAGGCQLASTLINIFSSHDNHRKEKKMARRMAGIEKDKTLLECYEIQLHANQSMRNYLEHTKQAIDSNLLQFRGTVSPDQIIQQVKSRLGELKEEEITLLEEQNKLNNKMSAIQQNRVNLDHQEQVKSKNHHKERKKDKKIDEKKKDNQCQLLQNNGAQQTNRILLTDLQGEIGENENALKQLTYTKDLDQFWFDYKEKNFGFPIRKPKDPNKPTELELKNQTEDEKLLANLQTMYQQEAQYRFLSEHSQRAFNDLLENSHFALLNSLSLISRYRSKEDQKKINETLSKLSYGFEAVSAAGKASWLYSELSFKHAGYLKRYGSKATFANLIENYGGWKKDTWFAHPGVVNVLNLLVNPALKMSGLALQAVIMALKVKDMPKGDMEILFETISKLHSFNHFAFEKNEQNFKVLNGFLQDNFSNVNQLLNAIYEMQRQSMAELSNRTKQIAHHLRTNDESEEMKWCQNLRAKAAQIYKPNCKEFIGLVKLFVYSIKETFEGNWNGLLAYKNHTTQTSDLYYLPERNMSFWGWLAQECNFPKKELPNLNLFHYAQEILNEFFQEHIDQVADFETRDLEFICDELKKVMAFTPLVRDFRAYLEKEDVYLSLIQKLNDCFKAQSKIAKDYRKNLDEKIHNESKTEFIKITGDEKDKYIKNYESMKCDILKYLKSMQDDHVSDLQEKYEKIKNRNSFHKLTDQTCLLYPFPIFSGYDDEYSYDEDGHEVRTWIKSYHYNPSLEISTNFVDQMKHHEKGWFSWSPSTAYFNECKRDVSQYLYEIYSQLKYSWLKKNDFILVSENQKLLPLIFPNALEENIKKVPEIQFLLHYLEPSFIQLKYDFSYDKDTERYVFYINCYVQEEKDPYVRVILATFDQISVETFKAYYGQEDQTYKNIFLILAMQGHQHGLGSFLDVNYYYTQDHKVVSSFPLRFEGLYRLLPALSNQYFNYSHCHYKESIQTAIADFVENPDSLEIKQSSLNQWIESKERVIIIQGNKINRIRNEYKQDCKITINRIREDKEYQKHTESLHKKYVLLISCLKTLSNVDDTKTIQERLEEKLGIVDPRKLDQLLQHDLTHYRNTLSMIIDNINVAKTTDIQTFLKFFKEMPNPILAKIDSHFASIENAIRNCKTKINRSQNQIVLKNDFISSDLMVHQLAETKKFSNDRKDETKQNPNSSSHTNLYTLFGSTQTRQQENASYERKSYQQNGGNV